ncbi:hypothetical protein QRX60_21990 [Amycolatopsis mongoliensis]|uniref:DUF559 domain-containing protein n=1 Tax=Amycolatopsis mongoliensis TaxID=715475 RepID=A0A9Y2JYP8_9PSEU|nr:hypothetical protein [Amycolatopsis sp. 4-36]WIY06385.1 hypothetical protein QRX60_21990 [Amycolatopsis sp. 4-36]
MRRGDWTRHPLLNAGRPQVVRANLLESMGVPRRTVSRRCEPPGPWQRLLPGIVLLGSGEPTDEHRIRAALLHGRDGAVLTGIHALHRHGLRKVPVPRDVHVLIPAGRRVSSSSFVHIERTTRLPRARLLDGLPVAPAHRAVVDAARRLRDHDTVLAMMAEAIQRRFCTPSALAHELAAGSRAGKALPTRALAPLLDGARSVAEADAWRLRKRSGLPDCGWNVQLFDSGGRYVASPDAWWDDVGFAWEIDSRSHHADPHDHARTLARNTRYLTAGVLVLQTLPVRLRTEPEVVLDELRAGYEIARGRPRPDVHVR